MIKLKKLLSESGSPLNEEPIAVAPEEIYKLYMELYNLGHKIAAAKKRGNPSVTPKQTKLWSEVLGHISKAQDVFTVLHAYARKGNTPPRGNAPPKQGR